MESLVKETEKQNKKNTEQNLSTTSKLDQEAQKDFLHFLEKNKDTLETGMGAFHTDNHSNW